MHWRVMVAHLNVPSLDPDSASVASLPQKLLHSYYRIHFTLTALFLVSA